MTRKFLAIPLLLMLTGCLDFAVAKWDSSSAGETISGAVLPISLAMPGDSVATELSRIQADRDVLIERLRVQDVERADVEEQIAVVTAQIDIIPAFILQERRLTSALNADAITSNQAADAFRLASIGKDALDAMVQAQQDRDDDAEKLERGVLVGVITKLTAELDRLGV